ncbi:MAG: hypothetical protein POG24_10190 [Acidocella sp.]|nr:hypothetical protein [Acidocella sp.]
MTHARPLPGPDALDSLARRTSSQHPCESAGVQALLGVIILQLLILILAPYHPNNKVPPPCLTLLGFLAEDDFNLPSEYAAALRAILLPILFSLPYPYPIARRRPPPG